MTIITDRFLVRTSSLRLVIINTNVIIIIIVVIIIIIINYRLNSGVAPILGGDNGGLTLAEISFNGRVRLMVPAILSISCIMDMTMYPFDTQRCNLNVGKSLDYSPS